MSVTDNNNNGSGGLPTSVMEPPSITEHPLTQDVNSIQEPAPKFATRADIKGVEGISKSKLILLGSGLAVAVLFFVFTAIVGKSPRKPAPVKRGSQYQQAKQEQATPSKSSVTPLMDTPRTPAPDNTTGQLGPSDIRRTRTLNGGETAKPFAGSPPSLVLWEQCLPSQTHSRSGKIRLPTAGLRRQRHRKRSRTV